MYDFIIVGAGINGCATAYELKNSKQKVLVLDMQGIASGGSGAAGAFISAKFSKSGELKELINKAFLYSLEFYEQNFSQHLTKTKLFHIAKDDKDNKNIKEFKKTTILPLLTPSKELLDLAKDMQYVFMEAGIVDAASACKALLDGVDFCLHEVKNIEHKNGFWEVDESYKAKHIILATGAYRHLLDESYLGIRGIWGHRIDIKTTTKNPYSIHQFVSISPNSDDKIAIGATHDVHYHPQINKEPYDINKGRAELLERAGKSIKLCDVEVIKDYVGLRSGSSDYMPLVGKMVDSKKTLSIKGLRLHVKKQDFTKYAYYPNLYVINGNGGYGFVLAPYLAKKLKEFILDGKELDKGIMPARFFARWVRRAITKCNQNTTYLP